MNLTEAIIELYKKTATELPEDVVLALKKSEEKEKGLGKNTLKDILKNIQLAKEKAIPICQDTGTPIFYVSYPRSYSQDTLEKSIIEATDIATKQIPLRPNAVDIIKNKNIGNYPIINFSESDKLKIQLMLKGGGSENIGLVYKLPDANLKANRDLNGVKKCVIDAMFKAQGKGCSPNILGVGIGGQIDETMKLAKKQLLRKLDDENKEPILAEMEKELLDNLNKLGIGPLGLGGKTTALGVKIGSMYRHPASFFVAISFMCWACRRKILVYDKDRYEITD